MIRYCQVCWHEYAMEMTACPHCGHKEDDQSDLVGKYIAAIRHKEPSRAALAIQVLCDMMHERRAIPALISLLPELNDAYVAKTAVEALGKFADPRAVDALSRLVQAATRRW